MELNFFQFTGNPAKLPPCRCVTRLARDHCTYTSVSLHAVAERSRGKPELGRHGHALTLKVHEASDQKVPILTAFRSGSSL